MIGWLDIIGVCHNILALNCMDLRWKQRSTRMLIGRWMPHTLRAADRRLPFRSAWCLLGLQDCIHIIIMRNMEHRNSVQLLWMFCMFCFHRRDTGFRPDLLHRSHPMVPMKWKYVPEGFEEKASIELRRFRSFGWTHQIVGGVGQNYSNSQESFTSYSSVCRLVHQKDAEKSSTRMFLYAIV